MIAKQIFPLIKAVRPKMSATEAQALHAGTVGFEGELFSGKPDFEKLLKNSFIRILLWQMKSNYSQGLNINLFKIYKTELSQNKV